MHQLFIHNTLTRKKEIFQPIHPPHVGMYVCGPTVYGDAHLGHARPAITFDVVFRYLLHLGYKVRYVRNITDVGHLENDADEGEDKIGKQAKLHQLEPMEVAQHYTNNYHLNMQQLNVKNPSIEPHASGHIIEQISMIEKILKQGLAYIVNGSVYFDVVKYNEKNNYGKLSGRVLEELMASERALDAQHEKRNKVDFALWKQAMPEHIMRWQSPWGEGFPGWHIECSAMSAKYLGETFDIHGGGMDLLFPHHECEIAQSQASNGKEPVKYWLHNNMITINGQKMGKSLGNFITLNQLFTGEHALLEQAYSPMTIRFFILQTQYRSTLDFSNDALKAAEKGYKRLMNAYNVLKKINYEYDAHQNNPEDKIVNDLCDACYEQMNDDFNTAQVLASLFELATKINAYKNEKPANYFISKNTFEKLQHTYSAFIEDILGLQQEEKGNSSLTDDLVNLFITFRQEARNSKDFATSDKIRNGLQKIGVQLKDEKGNTSWNYEG